MQTNQYNKSPHLLLFEKKAHKSSEDSDQKLKKKSEF